MPDPGPGAASEFNTRIIEEFRANGGCVGGPLAGTPMILATVRATHDIAIAPECLRPCKNRRTSRPITGGRVQPAGPGAPFGRPRAG
jgi:hypothetical protein